MYSAQAVNATNAERNWQKYSHIGNRLNFVVQINQYGQATWMTNQKYESKWFQAPSAYKRVAKTYVGALNIFITMAVRVCKLMVGQTVVVFNRCEQYKCGYTYAI